MQGISSYLISKSSRYKHIKIVTYISIAVLAIATLSIPFIINNSLLLYVNYTIRGLLGPIASVYIYSNLLEETRKNGISNKGVLLRLNCIYAGSAISFILPLILTVTSSFIAIGLVMLFSCIFLDKRKGKNI